MNLAVGSCNLVTIKQVQPKVTRSLVNDSKIVTSDNFQFSNNFSLTFSEHKYASIHSKAIFSIDSQIKVTTNVSELYKIPSNRYLAEGSYSFVYKGTLHSKMSRQEVAIKKLKLGQDGDLKESFEKERDTLLSLQKHKDNIVQLICAVEVISSNDFYLVMELGDMTLGTYLGLIQSLPKIKIDLDNLMFIVIQLFKSLDACKQENAFNVDLHLENYLIFFTQQKIKMIDFGEVAEKKANYSSIIAQMIRQTTSCFIECAIDNGNNQSCDYELEYELKSLVIQYALTYDLVASDKSSNFIMRHIVPYLYNNYLLLTIAKSGLFNTDGNIFDIKESIAVIGTEYKIKPLTDIRDMV